MGYSPRGCKELEMTEATFMHTFNYCPFFSFTHHCFKGARTKSKNESSTSDDRAFSTDLGFGDEPYSPKKTVFFQPLPP